MKKEYLIIGSNNFWYSSCSTSLKEVEVEIRKIKKDDEWYADAETGHQPEKPEKLYIYEAKEIKQIYL